MPQGARVGTSALRRQAQILALRPDLQVQLFRGNVGTRLAKLAAGEVDATLLALAGLKRLGLADKATAILSYGGDAARRGPGRHRRRDPRR